MNAFDITLPRETDFVKDMFKEIRGIKSDFQDRFSLDHNFPSNLDNTYYHKKLTLANNTNIPLLNNTGVIFGKMVNGRIRLVYKCKNKSGNIVEVILR